MKDTSKSLSVCFEEQIESTPLYIQDSCKIRWSNNNNQALQSAYLLFIVGALNIVSGALHDRCMHTRGLNSRSRYRLLVSVPDPDPEL